MYHYTDNTGWSAAREVFGNDLKRILCRWHVDRHVVYLQCYKVMSCHVMSCMLISLINHRAWKYHLRGVKPENQINMYQTCILGSETSKVFHTWVKQFTKYWSMIEPQFIYFCDNYTNSRFDNYGFELHVHVQCIIRYVYNRKVG